MKNLLIKVIVSLIIIGNAYANDNNLILVGTTGDYPPLTYQTESGYQGKDIRIFAAFAAANHFKFKLVATTWPSLSQDLIKGKFSVAIGGISDNKFRRRSFYLSNAIESSAKVPLIKCAATNLFSNFAQIDQDHVMVVENRGGTNQDFALEHLKHATIILYAQNDKALASLTQAPIIADVMFTDDTEANYWHQINPQLCVAAIPEKFTVAHKVFLFAKNAQGKALNKLFNSWWQINKIYYE
ncbi:MAG: transporter substrate-binding domain-containing protein [Burkholderiales bacterium]|nr:transporter substrate-binding domain-containing protein [Burkholderiales bacterium]